MDFFNLLATDGLYSMNLSIHTDIWMFPHGDSTLIIVFFCILSKNRVIKIFFLLFANLSFWGDRARGGKLHMKTEILNWITLSDDL